MSELDWLEREERYKTRISRTLVLTSLAAILFFGTGFYLLHRQRQTSERAQEEAAAAAILAERSRLQQEYAADSTATIQRLITFNEQYGAESLEGAPVVLVPVPRGANLTRFLQRAWLDYAHIVDPDLTEDEARQWYRSHYVDVMNMAWYNSAGHLSWEGEERPTAILLPDLRQKGKDLEFQKPSFTQVVRGQHEAGLRIEEMPEEGAEMGLSAPDSLGAATDGDETATAEPAPSP